MIVNEWKTRVLEYTAGLNSRLRSNTQARSLYYGFEVIDGPLNSNPEVMFVGINPGKGGGEAHHSVMFETERISYLDPFDESYKYPLAEGTIDLLMLAGLTENEIFDLLKDKCLKTNLMHIVTNQERDIKRALGCLGVGEYNEYYNRCNEFCIELVKALKPRLVVFEGKRVYEDIVEVCFEQGNTWDKTTNVGHYFSSQLNTHFLGYARRFSNIVSDRQALARHIQEIMAPESLLPKGSS